MFNQQSTNHIVVWHNEAMKPTHAHTQVSPILASSCIADGSPSSTPAANNAPAFQEAALVPTLATTAAPVPLTIAAPSLAAAAVPLAPAAVQGNCSMQFEQLGKADPRRTDRKMMFRVKDCDEDDGKGGMYLRVRVPSIAYVLLDCGLASRATCQSYKVYLNDQPIVPNVLLPDEDAVGAYYKWIHKVDDSMNSNNVTNFQYMLRICGRAEKVRRCRIRRHARTQTHFTTPKYIHPYTTTSTHAHAHASIPTKQTQVHPSTKLANTLLSYTSILECNWIRPGLS